MTDRTGIFEGDNPFVIAQSWLDEAQADELNDPNAMSLATVDPDGLPNVRIVLLKGIEADGFVFYTNFESTKAAELESSGMAAFVIHWKSLRRQIRVRGPVTRVPSDQADAYFASRSLKSRLGAWASQQSRPLKNRAELERALEDVTARFAEAPPRPPHWGGYKIEPKHIEFWADGAYRLHNRFRWIKPTRDSEWEITRLHP